MAEKHHVVVDGSNLATEGRTSPSLEQLDRAVRDYAEEYPGTDIVVVVDASFEHRIDPKERDRLHDAELHGEVVSPPAGAIGRGDAFVLRIAERTGATVLSNDSFQEFHGQHPWLFDKGRLIGGKPVPGVGWIFTPRIPVRGPKSRQATGKAKRDGDAALAAPAKAAELAKAARKVAARRAVKPDGTPPKVGDVWEVPEVTGAPGGSAAPSKRAAAKKAARKAGASEKAGPVERAGKLETSEKAGKTERVERAGQAETVGKRRAGGAIERTTKAAKKAKAAVPAKAAKKVGAAQKASKEDEPAKAVKATKATKKASKAAGVTQATAAATAVKATKATKAATKARAAKAAKEPTTGAAPAPATKKAKKAKQAKKATKATEVGHDETTTTAVVRSRRPVTDVRLLEAIHDATAEALDPSVVDAAEGSKSGGKKGKSASKGSKRRRAAPPPAVNEPLAFINFVAAYPVGSEVEGEVASYTSHGAMIEVGLPNGGAIHCYVPLTGLGDPPPRKAREVLLRGQRQSFVLVGLDPPRRVAELALPGMGGAASAQSGVGA
jgi:hypothetical protein